MAFSEKLYTLRRKSGLSQEQLAEQLNVSRQAISKWESGLSVPETDKLLAVSRYFNVSLDFLMKEGEEPAETPAVAEQTPVPQNPGRVKLLLGIVLCVGAVVCLIIWGALSAMSPEVPDRISESSMISIDGSGILLLVCIAAMIFGAVLILTDSTKK